MLLGLLMLKKLSKSVLLGPIHRLLRCGTGFGWSRNNVSLLMHMHNLEMQMISLSEPM
jgi:hypothetical protein